MTTVLRSLSVAGVALLSAAGVLHAQTFSDPGFVAETIYQGNGMISMAFDHEGRLYVTEKQGRILQFEPNDEANQTAFSYQYFEGNWTQLPDFSSLTPVATGTATTIDVSPRLRDDYFGLRFTGTFIAPVAGDYTFYTISDDGSRLYINGSMVVDNDGLHGSQERTGVITLAAGAHELVVDYFEAAGGEYLEAGYEGPNSPRQQFGANSGPYRAPTVFADYRSLVNADGERGLLGLALDPDFANNRHLFVLYSTATDQRVIRLTADAAFTAVEPGSEIVLLSGLPNATPVHNAGDIHFRPGDPYRLYIALGDDGDRYVVGDLDLYTGKILRIDSSTGLGVSDNPHWNGDPDSVRSRIWAHRFRNPFRFAFDPADEVGDVIYISENGDGTDRVVRIEAGADGGWDPLFLTSSVDGSRTILQATPPSLTGIVILRGGPFAPDGPALYLARYGFGAQKEVRRWRLVGEKLDQLEPFPEDDGAAFLADYPAFNIVSLTPGPEGALYFTDSNQGSSTGSGYRLGRIRYVGGEPPTVGFDSLPVDSSGEAPLQVDFSDLSQPGGQPIVGWAWDFGDGSTSTSPAPSHTYLAPGVYTVRLTVTDQAGLQSTTTTTVTVVRTLSLTLSGRVVDARVPRLAPLAAPTELRLYQADGSTPLAFADGLGPDGNALAVAAGGEFNVTIAAGLTAAGLVVSAGEPAGDGVGAALAGFALELDAGPQTIEPLFLLAPTLVAGRLTDTRGEPVSLDLGLWRGSPAHPYATADAAPGGAHRLPVDALGYFHFAVRAGEADVVFTLDTGGSALAETHGRARAVLYVEEGERVWRDIVVGRYDAGEDRDDLSGQPVTPDINFAAQIQPLFTALCVACHNDIATNSGGLDLQPGASLSALVGRPSTQAAGVMLVEPGRPERSYLMEKINAARPQVGTRMRPGDPMPAAQQALIRDWIAQLAPTPTAYGTWSEAAFGEPAGAPGTEPAADHDGDGLSNLLEYALGTSPTDPADGHAGPQVEIIEVGGDRHLLLTVNRDPDAVGVAWQIETSDDIGLPTAWTPVEHITLVDTPSLLVAQDAVPLSESPRRFIRARATLVDEEEN